MTTHFPGSDYTNDQTLRDWKIRITDPAPANLQILDLRFPDLSNLTLRNVANKSKAWLNTTNKDILIVKAIWVEASDGPCLGIAAGTSAMKLFTNGQEFSIDPVRP